MAQRKKDAARGVQGTDWAVGLAVGIAVGAVFGTALGDVAIGISLGIAFGVVVALYVDDIRKRRADRDE